MYEPNDNEAVNTFKDFRNFAIGVVLAIVVVSFSIGFSCGVKSVSW